MIDGLGFIEPWWLWSLGGIPLLILFLARQKVIKRKLLLQWGGDPSALTFPSLWVVSLICVLFIISLARPYLGYRDVSVPGRFKDVALIVDISRSMLAADTPPSRLDAARHKIRDIIEYVKNTSPGDRIGIVLFAGEAYLYCPLTADYGVLNIFADSLSTDLITSQGTDLRGALEVAIKSFKDTKAALPHIILLSDGEDQNITIEQAEAVLSEDKLPLDILGFGTTEGAPINLGREGFITDVKGRPVISKLAEESLRALAVESGGNYLRAAIDDSDIKSLLGSRIGGHERSILKNRTVRVYNEIAPWLLSTLACLLLFLALCRRLSLVFALFPLLLAANSEAQFEDPKLYEAYRSYTKGDYKLAEELLSASKDSASTVPEIAHALGKARYRNGDFKGAAKSFEEARSGYSRGRDIFESSYDLGNAFLMGKEYEKAVQAYDEALKIKPDDEAAIFNRNLAKKMQEEQDNKQERKEKSEDKPQESPTSSPPQSGGDESSSPSPSPTSTSSPQDSDGGVSQPTPSPTSSPSPSPSQEDAALEENKKPLNEEALKQEEAKAWLDSLSDSPVLLRRKVGRPKNTSGQTW